MKNGLLPQNCRKILQSLKNWICYLDLCLSKWTLLLSGLGGLVFTCDFSLCSSIKGCQGKPQFYSRILFLHSVSQEINQSSSCHPTCYIPLYPYKIMCIHKNPSNPSTSESFHERQFFCVLVKCCLFLTV